MAQMAAILLLTFLVRSISGSPINGKCFTTRYRKKNAMKKRIRQFEYDKCILF